MRSKLIQGSQNVPATGDFAGYFWLSAVYKFVKNKNRSFDSESSWNWNVIRSYRFPVMNKKKTRCMQCLSWHCQSVLILWHFNCSLDFFNFSLRGTQIHPKNLHFWDQLKASFSSNICPYCISCHHRHLFLVIFFYLDTIYTTRYVTVHL